MILEEHLVLNETDQREYHLQRHTGTGQIWASGVSWNEPVNKDLSRKASRWFDERPALKNIQIPRCLRATAPVREVTLHTFVDAS